MPALKTLELNITRKKTSGEHMIKKTILKLNH